ncbi:SusD/RagB family nutrient-binding outer membrane lipoprotein [Pedobacter lithocola]|uniref:SusD/RagB family nutrient-binding outer membrane lipoprotein n=1 Tax=Pedobacter lithocola TaxID=1908239 RepID=A0ABV8P9B1_9SPHI
MKKILNTLLIFTIAVGFSSCKKYLDINENTNSSTTSSPALVLPQAIVGSASITNTYNTSFFYPGGFQANIFGVGGYGGAITYAYSSSNFTGLFTSVYDNAVDYQYVIDNSSTPALAYSSAIARIMKAFMFSKLVDQYNDVPYSEALKGNALLTPKYDKAEDIYKDLVSQLSLAIKAINDGQAGTVANKVVASTDPLFKGDMNLWKQFANTVKLRLLIKMAGVPALNAYAKTELAALGTTGFLSTDALVQPGYVKEAGRQSPSYNSLGFGSDNARSQGQQIPTKWILSFYTLAGGGKLTDPGRGSVIYRGFPSTATNQLGEENATSSQVPPTGFSSWFTGVDANTPGLGVAKGPSQGQPIMLAAESNFLQAEAIVRGYITGTAKSAYTDGVTASFSYLYKNQSGVVDASKNVAADVATYFTANAGSRLANFDLALTDEQKIEAIITQKYIALNVINADEAFNEFRRTTYPAIVNGSNNPLLTFASKVSVSTRADKLLGRILYPQQEFNLNPSNVPQGITLFGSRIFWDLN